MGQVMVVDPSDLSASMTYNVNIECTDSKGTDDVQLLTVNCLSNTVPRVVGFQGIYQAHVKHLRNVITAIFA